MSGRGVVRSWTVVRQSFLPGFDVPFVLVDVELCRASRPPAHRQAARRRRCGAASRRRSTCRLRGPRRWDRRSRLRADAMTVRNRVAVVGYAHSTIERRAHSTVGRRCGGHRPGGDRRCRSDSRPDRRLRRVEHAAERGRASGRRRRQRRHADLVGAQSRRNAALRRGIRRHRAGQWLGRDGRQRVDQRRRRLRRRAPCATQPRGQLPRQCDARGPRRHAMDCAARVLRAVGDDRAALQRVPSALRRPARIDGGGRDGGPEERIAAAVVALA